MSDNVIHLVEATTSTAKEALEEAAARGLTTALVVGYTPEGSLYLRSSGDVTRKDALWMLEVARHRVVMDDDEGDDE